MEKIQNNWHSLKIEEIFTRLGSSQEGISSHEAQKRLKFWGFNEITTKKKKNLLVIFLSQFKSPLIYILLLAAVVTYFLRHTVDTWVILGVVFFNALFGLFHELKAERALEALSKLMALKTRVKRDGVLLELPALELVPGDVVEISPETKIPADLRIIQQDDLRIDEAMLTGESIPEEKNTEVLSTQTPVADRKNMLFSGTMVISGRGWAMVAATGSKTEFGKIISSVSKTEETRTPLQIKLSQLSQKLIFLVLGAVLFIFIEGLIRGIDFLSIFLISLAAAVSAIPEGLPAVITIALATGAFRMAQKKAIVRKLIAVETLGSITTIASDKTGTLTHNQMTIEKIYLAKDQKIYQVSGSGYEPVGEFSPSLNENLSQFLRAAVLCSDAEIFEENNEWAVAGDPTEGAIVAAAAKAQIAKEKLEKNYPRLDSAPFETKKGYMVTLNQSQNNNFLIVKGKIENILPMSSLKKDKQEEIIAIMKDFAWGALRVIAVAAKKVAKDKKEISEQDLTNLDFLGLAGMMDPPRKEAMTAIKACQASGIRPIMITGDYSLTAQAVACQLGIIQEDEGGVVSGPDLEKMDPYEFQKTIKKAAVYARITPELKLKIVEGLQDQGEVVAVTGDGINDAPALKRADIGVAMGEGGTDAAREVADLVLADNNFQTIVAAIEEGRTIFQNIRRVVFYLLSTNLGELMIIMFSILFYAPPFNLPLLPVQILWLNLVTDGTAGISLALEPTHPGIIKYPPRLPQESILSKIIISRIFLVSLIMLLGTMFLYYLEIRAGSDISRARTMAFATMVVFQVFNILNSRSLRESIFKMPFFSNKYILGSMIISFSLSYLTVALPAMQNLFHTVTLSMGDWLKIFLLALLIIVAVEVEKLIRRRTNAKY